MTKDFGLPPAHPVRAIWIPLHYFPLIGSNNCFTIAVVLISDKGERRLIQANGLEKLYCIYGTSAQSHISFLETALGIFRERLDDFAIETMHNFEFGSALVFGEPKRGSGLTIEHIGTSWLSKISLLHNADITKFELAAVGAYSVEEAETVEDDPVPEIAEVRLATALKSQVQSMNIRLGSNFNRNFQPKGRVLPVKLGYSGENLVADFDRVAPRGLTTSFSRIRSKLWVLAEHREQTRHEKPRTHEMLVIPSNRFSPLQADRDIQIFNQACHDIEKEADRREIRFRRFDNSELAARHIFTMETTGRPLTPIH